MSATNEQMAALIASGKLDLEVAIVLGYTVPETPNTFTLNGFEFTVDSEQKTLRNKGQFKRSVSVAIVMEDDPDSGYVANLPVQVYDSLRELALGQQPAPSVIANPVVNAVQQPAVVQQPTVQEPVVVTDTAPVVAPVAPIGQLLNVPSIVSQCPTDAIGNIAGVAVAHKWGRVAVFTHDPATGTGTVCRFVLKKNGWERNSKRNSPESLTKTWDATIAKSGYDVHTPLAI